MSEEIKETCPRCGKVAKLFYNFKKSPLCSECLNFELTKAKEELDNSLPKGEK